MATRFDLVKHVNMDFESKIWKLKVRVMSLWKLPISNDRHMKPMVEMVLMDEESQRIQLTIRNQHIKFFENDIVEGKVFIISNFEVAINKLRFKATRHEFRLLSKRETQLRSVDDTGFPLNGFEFVPNSIILSEVKEELHLVDVMGLLTAKGNLIEYTKNGMISHKIVIELDDLKDNGKLRCTLWEDFATQLTTYINDHQETEYIVILQFAKMKYYNGVMSVSNTNYTSKLFINADFPEVSQFRQRIAELDSANATQVTHIDNGSAYSMQDDFLRQTAYKPISELMEITERSTFVTLGTVQGIEGGGAWWYKGCKKCSQSLKDYVGSFHCDKCETYPLSFIPRYSIRLRVADDVSSASFIIYEREAAKFLNVSSNDLRSSYVSRGGDKNAYPEEINVFKGKRFLFKVSVKLENLNAYQPCSVTVLKLCSDEALISDFIQKYNIDDIPNAFHEHSEFISNPQDSSGLLKETWSQSGDTQSEFDSAPFVTPSKPLGGEVWAAKASEFSPHDAEESSTKMRKVVKEHND